MELEAIKRRIINCIEKIYEDDSYLLKHNNHEITISSKLAQYLFLEFKNYNVDCEYNKNIDIPKRIEESNSIFRPDIVIHKRGNNENNLVCIEIKTSHNNQTRLNDYSKLKSITKQSGNYKYKLGVFIDFNKNKKNLIVKYFEDGKECS